MNAERARVPVFKCGLLVGEKTRSTMGDFVPSSEAEWSKLLAQMYLEKSDRMVQAFSQCVERMPEKMVMHRDNLDLVRHVLMPPGELVPLFVLTGSSKFRSTSWGSDIDVRFLGTDFQVLLDRLAELETHVRLDYTWRARNLVTLSSSTLSLDVLVVNDFHQVMPFNMEPWMTPERREVANKFNLTMGTTKDPIPYLKTKADAIDTLYGIALGSRLGRSVVAYLKMLDGKISTCITVVVAALVVDCVPEERLASPNAGFDIALEIAGQFAHRFTKNVRHENHIFWSFKSVWGNFCDKYLAPFRNLMKCDPLQALYAKESQYTSVKNSLMWVQLCKDYDIDLPDGPGRMLDQPRPIPITVMISLATYCVGVTTMTERKLRESSAKAGLKGCLKMAADYCRTPACPPYLSTFILSDANVLHEGVVCSLECLVYPSTWNRMQDTYRLANP